MGPQAHTESAVFYNNHLIQSQETALDLDLLLDQPQPLLLVATIMKTQMMDLVELMKKPYESVELMAASAPQNVSILNALQLQLIQYPEMKHNVFLKPLPE